MSTPPIWNPSFGDLSKSEQRILRMGFDVMIEALQDVATGIETGERPAWSGPEALRAVARALNSYMIAMTEDLDKHSAAD
jgi:hypothetical protein